ncbi:cupin [Candidatus Daviesbacteria bacterium]|nr:cupin [Candidatus Daviesbacteria bacterium]
MRYNIPMPDNHQSTNTPYIKKVEKPWGYELHFVPEGSPYMGKVLHINGGTRLSLQVHDKKMESWYLLSGKVKMILENSQGELEEVNMEKGYGYTTNINQQHRLVGEEDSDVLEVSTPEIGNTYRLEDDYKRGTETEELRKDPNRGWHK